MSTSPISSTKLDDLIKHGEELKKFPFLFYTVKQKVDRYGNVYPPDQEDSPTVRLFGGGKLSLKNVYYFKGYEGVLKAWVDRVSLHFKRRYSEFSEEAQKVRSLDYKKGFLQYLSKTSGKTVILSSGIFSKKLALRQQKQLQSWQQKFIDEHLKLLNKITPPISILKIDSNASEKVAEIVFSEKRLAVEVKNKLVGNLVCQSIAQRLRYIARNNGFTIKEKDDDIQNLSRLLKDQRNNKKLKRFFTDHYKTLSLADQVRNKSCHVYEKAPSRHQISVCIDLLRVLNRL